MASKMHPETAVIHAGHLQEPQGALVSPLYQSATFVFDRVETGSARFAGEQAGPIYTRLGNPTVAEFERRMAELEGYDGAVAFASGMAAVSAVLLGLLDQGDHLICNTCLYGCTHSLVSEQLPRFGIEVTAVDFADIEAIRAAIRPNTRMLLLETPVNPHLAVYDLAAVASLARAHQLISVVDNTFMTPLLQQPKTQGIDIVLHSATKYLNGHGDVIAGVVCADQVHLELLRSRSLKDIGGVLSPHDAWLILRGMKTLALRMERHSVSAQVVAEFLQRHPAVTRVYYPGLDGHPGKALIGTQMRAGGGVLALELKADFEQAVAFVNRLSLFKIAVSLGDAESLVQHPASMTHATYDSDDRARAGIADTLIRLSIGLEHCDDLLADLTQGLAPLTAGLAQEVS
ncbi:PLP-dependent aspartate aminotransferase family protein [Ferrimonas sp. SCSIO 43195]|uniref:trans-sulfuration enzyme family protein n=1 Tax=Ferrimonas sp. SCSIO 43195 TaxID=2822844 RepID=UPI002075077F|nr:aminotransferase class I/II-fold pyridoxal phosphate-dependent enzyme [Ferrimonas sp. SCSIO 43195]USD38570.1 aminotransferase class I/II-fold pyridoxal phosphate-dependent enzyme [Ferrimonas sp. SCSIO 43195]